MDTLNGADVESRRRLRQFVEDLGYPGQLVVEDFPVWMPTAVVKADLIAFGDTPLDMNSATLLGSIGGEGDRAREYAFSMARVMAAPATVMISGDELELWWLASVENSPERIGTVASNDSQAAQALGRSLGPRTLLSAKRGATQGTLFPVEVRWLEQTRGSAVDRLADLVAAATVRTDEQLRAANVPVSATRLSRLVLAALTYAFIRDRFSMLVGSPAWNEYLSATHPHLQQWTNKLGRAEHAILLSTVADLSESVNLSGLDPSLMSSVYENTLLSAQERSDLGVVYTPSDLAKRIMTNLPFEEIPPDNRRVLDPTCGSGTLLLAAHDRLRSLVNIRNDHVSTHEWLVGHLRGWDTDAFAVEVARLCLTLNALPNGNGWHIDRYDALNCALTEADRPSIIVANPPWKGVRSNTENSRDDTAVVFLHKMLSLLQPEGLLGVVLPLGWLTADHTADSRQLVRELCEVLEIWRLPEKTFQRAEAAPAVLLARKTSKVKRRYHIERRVLRRESLPRLYFHGVADETALVQTTSDPNKRRERRASFTSRPLTGRIAAKSWDRFLGDLVRLRSGPPRHRNAGSGIGEHLWASKLSRRPYFSAVEIQDCIHVRFPDDFDPRAGGSLSDYQRRKILVTGKIRPDNPWPARARLDLLGVIPSDGYIMALPDLSKLPQGLSEEAALHALLALFGSAFVSAWIDERRTTRNIPPQLFRDLPLPDGWAKLALLGEKLERSAQNVAALLPLVQELDQKVFDLYSLSTPEREAIQAHFAYHTAPEGVLRFPSPPPESPTPSENAVDTYGCVLDVSATGMHLWAAGLTPDDGLQTPLPPRMLGALLHGGLDFRVRSDGLDLLHAEYFIHASAWRSPTLAPTSTGSINDITAADTRESLERWGLDVSHYGEDTSQGTESGK